MIFLSIFLSLIRFPQNSILKYSSIIARDDVEALPLNVFCVMSFASSVPLSAKILDTTVLLIFTGPQTKPSSGTHNVFIGWSKISG